MGNLELGFGACGWWGWDLRLNNYHGTPDKFSGGSVFINNYQGSKVNWDYEIIPAGAQRG